MKLKQDKLARKSTRASSVADLASTKGSESGEKPNLFKKQDDGSKA